MRFWAREIAGWALVGLGLFVLFQCFALLMDHYIIEGGPLTFIGIIIFRGGIHLLKMSVAARVCLHAEGKLETTARPAASVVATTGRRAGRAVAIRR